MSPLSNLVSDPVSNPVIETVDLSKRYGSVVALAGLTMNVPAGEVFGFLGPNGAGKTSAMRLMLGLGRASGGAGRVLGAPLGDRRVRARIGYLPELFRYQGWMTASEVLRLHLRLGGVARREWPTEIEGCLATVGLADRAGSRVDTFSKGMQQRLGLGVALLGKPDLVFLDEPTSALDPVGRHDVRAIVRDVAARGATVFLNSHMLGEVERICDRVAIVDGGHVIASGTLDEIRGGAPGVPHGVRIEVEGVSRADLATWGALSEPAGSASDKTTSKTTGYTIAALSAERIPDLVEDLVRRGGRVHAVEPVRHDLEERFLQLLDGEPEA